MLRSRFLILKQVIHDELVTAVELEGGYGGCAEKFERSEQPAEIGEQIKDCIDPPKVVHLQLRELIRLRSLNISLVVYLAARCPTVRKPVNVLLFDEVEPQQTVIKLDEVAVNHADVFGSYGRRQGNPLDFAFFQHLLLVELVLDEVTFVC